MNDSAALVKLPGPCSVHPMRITDLDAVRAIEESAYAFPWTHGNFVDSLASGYRCRTLHDASGCVLGYFLLMIAVDEAHLLNITVMPALHGKGLGRMLLDHAVELVREEGALSMLLEVRPSNVRAIQIYERYGFHRIGLRRNYYPAKAQDREDAIVMRLTL